MQTEPMPLDVALRRPFLLLAAARNIDEADDEARFEYLDALRRLRQGDAQ